MLIEEGEKVNEGIVGAASTILPRRSYELPVMCYMAVNQEPKPCDNSFYRRDPRWFSPY